MSSENFRQTGTLPRTVPGRHSGCPNVGPGERMASFIGGATLALWALSRPSFFHALMAFFGGNLLYRGVSGHCPVYQALGISTFPSGTTESLIAPEGPEFEMQETPVQETSPATIPPPGEITAQPQAATESPKSGFVEEEPRDESPVSESPSDVKAEEAEEEDAVDEASMESFPASDPPSFTPGHS